MYIYFGMQWYVRVVRSSLTYASGVMHTHTQRERGGYVVDLRVCVGIGGAIEYARVRYVRTCHVAS